jgi:hypothetical protein
MRKVGRANPRDLLGLLDHTRLALRYGPHSLQPLKSNHDDPANTLVVDGIADVCGLLDQGRILPSSSRNIYCLVNPSTSKGKLPPPLIFSNIRTQSSWDMSFLLDTSFTN